MKKLIAGVLAVGLAFTTVAGVHPEKADAAKKRKIYHVKGRFNGYADPTFFEIKVGKKYKVLMSNNGWYRKNLKEGRTYTYFYYKDKYGQLKVVKINK
ncbi:MULTISPECIES: hypothetical protein [Bacillus]|uniref:hypothetical protein n=1 Tax=Bacillus TaxID=1386 RepID=UPI0005B66506|nr:MULTISPECIES: hypothetical protein [Bacillus]AJO60801.1 hypothetical protein QF06_20210 [Bacillus sp. YP1]MEC2217465.1 hypothetical protein [Bacillus subtilis]QGI15743.1 hypothetical protein GII80_22005 [Bacillus subtilis]CAF1775779.1 hypothetical protein NRS6092_04147 [Bacillus subtilis]CAF1851331.1 hypothetical protein NRS6134_03972 [Bacillus subtilis]